MFGGCGRIMLSLALSLVLIEAPAKAFSRAESAKSAKKVIKPYVPEPHIGHARTYFRQNDYRAALLALGNKIEGNEAVLIAAESYYRLGNYDQATRYFEKIAKSANDAAERRKASIRLFDIAIKTNDTQAAINRYAAFGKEYKQPTALMRYSLGKTLFDHAQYERAENILRRIPKDSEFFMRARYLIATAALDKKTPDELAKLFNEIEALKPVSVEDYTVRELAILAQGRIYAEAKKEDLAEKAYARVSLAGEFGVTATIETIRTMLARVSEARLAEGRFKKSSAFRKNLVESEAIRKALASVARYRKAHEIDWRKPELLTLMARLYVEAKRYDDARLAYQELIDHYRPIYDSILSKTNAELWPFFALNFERDSLQTHTTPLVAGVPDTLVSDIPEVKEVLILRDEIEEDERKLRALEERAINFGINNENILAARRRQTAMVSAYNAMAIKKQDRIKKDIANKLNQSLAEAEFDRADLVVIEMKDLKTQQNIVHDFQSEKIDQFENNMKELDVGGQI